MNDIVIAAGTEIVAQRQADSDEQLISLWLHGRGPQTVRAYRADVARLQRAIHCPLPGLTLPDLQAFADSLEHLSPASRARILASIKSLFAFAHKLGYLRF